jgi:hypothetical protein
MLIDPIAATQFLQVAYQPDDWVALFLKSYETGRVAQRVVPVSLATSDRLQEWLDRENGSGMNVYVSVNSLRPGQTSRRRHAISGIRHVYLDADGAGADVLAAITCRGDLPAPSYVLHTSPDRVHVLWRVTGFTKETSEALQRQLARELNTDTAATSCAQTTRLPGFLNQKYATPHLIMIGYRDSARVYEPADFPTPPAPQQPGRVMSAVVREDRLERARQYLSRTPPAIAGQRGDVLTFRVCCRLVRGFNLSNVDALGLLREWNERCQPPWSHRELLSKLRNARSYGREPVGAFIEDWRASGHPVCRNEFRRRAPPHGRA